MNQAMKKILNLMVATCFLISAEAAADEGRVSLIFSGDTGQELVFDLEQFNRIAFEDTFMNVSDYRAPRGKQRLRYSDYYRIAFDYRQAGALGDVSVSPDVSFHYDRPTSSLTLTAAKNTVFNVEISTVYGTLVYQTVMRDGDCVPLVSLPDGLYVAVAVGENDIQKIKFIK